MHTQSSVSNNRQALEWLFVEGKVRLKRSKLFDTPPAAHARPVSWEWVEGMLLGLAIGDALGNTSEGWNVAARNRRGEIRNYLPNRYAGNRVVGLPSDDTQLAMWTLEQINADYGLVPEHVARRFAGEEIFGIGDTVRAFVTDLHRGRPWFEAGQHSAGNGALMRIAPVVIPHLASADTGLWADAALAATITHNDSASTAACVAWVAMLWDLLGMARPPAPEWWLERYVAVASQLEAGEAYEPRGDAHAGESGPMWQLIERWVKEAHARKLSTLAACESWHSGAYLLETLPCVLYILMRHAGHPEEAMVRAVNDTRDNDTVAAIVGSALGALHGTAALPERWRSGLLGRLGADDDGHLFTLLAETRAVWRL